MRTIKSKHLLCVTLIIGFVTPAEMAEPVSLTLNMDEVECAFAVPLRYFANPTNCVLVEMVKWRGKDITMRTYIPLRQC